MVVSIETVHAQWKGFDLDELREKIESDLIDQFASEQQEMMTGRKQLVEITKDYRKLEDPDKAAKIHNLLRAYQVQIDASAQRFTKLENTVKQTLKPLLVLTNPATFLEASAHQSMLQQAVEATKAENSGLKALSEEQEDRIYGLESELTRAQLLAQQAATDQDAMKHEMSSLRSGLEGANNLIQTFQGNQQEMEKTMAILRHELEDTSRKDRQILLGKTAEIETLQSELEILGASLEQSRQQSLELQQSVTHLKLQISAGLGQANPHQERVAVLTAEKEQLEQHHQQDLQQHLARISQLAALAEAHKDYDGIQLELARLKETASGDRRAAEEQTATVKMLESEVVRLRLESDRSLGLIAQLRSALADGQARHGVLERTVETYEQMASLPVKDGSQQSLDESRSEDVIFVLTNQRERLRGRVKELEAQLQSALHTSEASRADLAKMKGENSLLFERLRYLENNMVFKAGSRNRDVELGGEMYEKYSPTYEAKHDPFQRFFATEFMQRVKELGRADQLIYKISRLFFTNRMGRKVSMYYFLTVHVVLFVLLWRSI